MKATRIDARSAAGIAEAVPRSAERPAALVALVAVSVSIALLTYLFAAPTGKIGGRFADVTTYYHAGEDFLQGRDIYASGLFRQWPLAAALCAPLALLPIGLADRAEAALILLLTEASFVLLYRRLNATPPGWSWLLVVLAGPLLLLTVYLGQMSGVSFAAYAAGLALLKRRPASAGICFAAMAIKPHLALLAIPALAGAAPAASVAFLLGLLIWPIGSVVVRGLSGMKEYILLLLRIHDGSAGLVTVRLSGLLPVSGAVFTLLQAVFGGLLVVFLVVLWLRCQLGRRTLGPGAVDAATAVALVALPWAVLYDLQFAATALLRLGYRGGRLSYTVWIAWWMCPLCALLFRPYGLGGIVALLPLALAATLLGRAHSLSERSGQMAAGGVRVATET